MSCGNPFVLPISTTPLGSKGNSPHRSSLSALPALILTSLPPAFPRQNRAVCEHAIRDAVPPASQQCSLRSRGDPRLCLLSRADHDHEGVHENCDCSGSALARGARPHVLQCEGGLRDT